MYGCATEKTDLAFCTSYEDEPSADETSADGEHIRARKYSSEGLPNDMCEISAVTKFTAKKEAAFGFATLAAQPSFSGSASESFIFNR